MATLEERVASLEGWRVTVEARMTALGQPEPTDPPGWPDASTTGPRVPLVESPAITTSRDGQVIEGLDVATRIRIQHSDVVVRDCRVRADGENGVYPIHVRRNPATGVVPTGVVIEWVEIAGQPGVQHGAPAVYSNEGNWTMRHCHVHDVKSGPRLTSNCVIEDSWMHSSLVTSDGSHKSGVGCNGGSHNVVRNNVIECDATGCSGALVLYGDFAPIDDVLVENNLLDTTGSYTVYGGSVGSKPFPHASNVRFLNNRFGRKHHPTGGRYGPVASWEPGRGNVWSGNVWDDTSEPVQV